MASIYNLHEFYLQNKYRILDRFWQGVVGETLIEGATSSDKIMNLNKFIKNCDLEDSEIYTWTKKLEAKLCGTSDKKLRQRILVFGVIIAALIDHFYLKFIKNRGKYYTDKER